MRCDSCEMVSINGNACHELGCRRAKDRYDVEAGEWIKQRECFYCGYMVDHDEPCCTEKSVEDDSSSYIQALRDAGRYR